MMTNISRKRSNEASTNAAVYFVLLIVGILSAGMCIVDNTRPDGYRWLFLMPLTFSFMSYFLFARTSVFSCIYSTIIVILYFVRMVLTPIIMVLGNYDNILGSIFERALFFSIILVCYETVFVFLFLYYLLVNQRDKSTEKTLVTNKPTKAILIFLVSVVLTFIVILRIDNSILNHTFLFLFNTNQEYYALSETDHGVGTLSMFATLAGTLFYVMEVLLAPTLLFYILRIRNISIRYFFAIVLVGIVCAFGTEERLSSLLAGIALLLTLNYTEGKRSESVFKWLMSFLMLGGIFALTIKTGAYESGSFEWGGICGTFCAYFSGLPTVAEGVLFVQDCGRFQLFKIIPDIISKVPYLPYAINLFQGVKLENSNMLFNQYISAQMGWSGGQILPTTMCGVRYFGYILGPLFPCLLVLLARHFEHRIDKQSNIILRNLYCWITVCVSMSLVMASGLLVVTKLAWFVFFLIIIKLLSKTKKT